MPTRFVTDERSNFIKILLEENDDLSEIIDITL